MFLWGQTTKFFKKCFGVYEASQIQPRYSQASVRSGKYLKNSQKVAKNNKEITTFWPLSANFLGIFHCEQKPESNVVEFGMPHIPQNIFLKI